MKGLTVDSPDQSLIQYPRGMHICDYQQKEDTRLVYSGFHETLAAPFPSLVANSRTGTGSWKVHCQRANEICNLKKNFGNFAPKVGTNLPTKFKVKLPCE